jgi:hypothetical protein
MLHLSRHSDVIEESLRLIADAPLREHFQALLGLMLFARVRLGWPGATHRATAPSPVTSSRELQAAQIRAPQRHPNSRLTSGSCLPSCRRQPTPSGSPTQSLAACAAC